MTLAANVQARVDNELLVALTNQGDRSASTVNSTRLGAAADDTAAQFEVLTGLAYDDTNAAHVAACVPGVVWFLQRYTGRDDGASGSYRDQFENAARQIALTTGSRALGTFETDSRFDPTREQQDAKPPFDRSWQRDYKIGWPDGDRESDLPSGG